MNFLLIPNLGGLGKRFEFLAMGLEPTTPNSSLKLPLPLFCLLFCLFIVVVGTWNCQVMQHNNNKGKYEMDDNEEACPPHLYFLLPMMSKLGSFELLAMVVVVVLIMLLPLFLLCFPSTS